jgi:alanine dehydrogenase
MSEEQKPIIPKELSESRFQPQTETLQVPRKRNKLFIGIPKETILQENRVALVPVSAAALVAHGHRVCVEAGAGVRAHYADHDYSEAGVEVVYSQEQVYKADVVLKVAPPTQEEIELMQPNQVIFSPLHLPIINQEYIEALRKKRVIALAMEYIKDTFGSFPVVRIMSEMAGMNAMLIAADLLTSSRKGKGVLLGGISGVPSSKVVILGAGVVAEFATRVALGLGADVRVFDNNVYKLMQLQTRVGRQLNTSTFNPLQLEKELLSADAVIGAVHSKSGRTPILVSEEIVSHMKDGSVIVDVSIDQGGCFATSEVTNHDNPTFVKHGVIHYCVPNIASRIGRTASIAVSNILMPILLKAGTTGGIERLIYEEPGLRSGIYAYKGSLTNEYLGERFKMKWMDIDLLMTSSL